MRYLTAILIFLCWTITVAAQDYSLSVPETVGIRNGFIAKWSGPQDTKGIIEIRPADGDGKRVGYGYIQAVDKPVPMEAPEQPGDYVVVLKAGKEDRVTRQMRVNPVTANLTAPQTTDAGAAVSVTWDGPNNRNDHVTFAIRDGARIRGSSYAYVGNSKDGIVKLTAPQDVQDYDIVYITGETILARSPIAVGGISAALDVPASVAAGAPIPVGFAGPRNAGDLITFATRDGEAIKPASYAYVGNARDDSLTLRAFEEPGDYDVVYLSGARVIGRAPIKITSVEIVISAPVEVVAGTAFEVHWQGQGNQGDRIDMIQNLDGNRSSYGYVDPLEEAVRISAPAESGDYTLIYLSRGGAQMTRRAVTVTPAPLAPGQIEVLAGAVGFGPEDAVQIILDASGSMLQRQNGTRRIDIAKSVLGRLVNDTIPPGTGFALRVFGNREADACRTDLEIPVGPHDPAAAAATIASIQAINLARTPIAESLALTRTDLDTVTGERILILITDGEETCEGDPASAIAALRAAGVDIRVNIVGYAIEDAALSETFESWATAGGGNYFDAADAAQLDAALRSAAAPRFEIFTAKGAFIGAGRAGDPPLSLPAGEYRLRVGKQEINASVAPDELTRISP